MWWFECLVLAMLGMLVYYVHALRWTVGIDPFDPPPNIWTGTSKKTADVNTTLVILLREVTYELKSINRKLEALEGQKNIVPPGWP